MAKWLSHTNNVDGRDSILDTIGNPSSLVPLLGQVSKTCEVFCLLSSIALHSIDGSNIKLTSLIHIYLCFLCNKKKRITMNTDDHYSWIYNILPW